MGRAGTHHICWLSAILTSGLSTQPTRHHGLAKGLRHIKWHLSTPHVITCPSQLVRDRLTGHGHFRFGLLALVIPLHLRMPANGKSGRLCIGPAQIRIAIFHVALPLPFAVADLRAVHTPTIGGIRTHMSKAPDVARFQQNRLSENRPDARDRLQQLIKRRAAHLGLDTFFHALDLLRQTGDYGESTADCEGLIAVGEKALKVREASLFDPIRPQVGARVAQNNILNTEHIGALLFDKMFAFAQQISYGPLGFGIDGSFGQHAQS